MKFFSIIHVILLAYIIAALSFWWLSLEKQSHYIYEQELKALSATLKTEKDTAKVLAEKEQIELRKFKRSQQYLGEGLTFLFVIMVGSFIVYSTYRFQNKLSRQQNNFMLSVTHELKSPIAAMKLILQTLQKHKLDPEKQKELLTRCVMEADRLNELCNNVLVASQMEGGQYKNEWKKVTVSEMMQRTNNLYSERYPNRFTTDIQTNLALQTDELLLQLVINNLVENAIKYTPSDTPIRLSLKEDNNKLVFQIADEGNGIPDSEKKKVFQKFYRLGNEDTRQTKGTGLGLYLSAKIMKHLKGQIVLKDNKPKGSIIELVFEA